MGAPRPNWSALAGAAQGGLGVEIDVAEDTFLQALTAEQAAVFEKSTPGLAVRGDVVRIVDSDHCVALLRGRLDLRGRISPTDDLAVTAISVGELMHGVHKSSRVEENLARLGVLLAAVIVLPYEEGAARRFGRAKAELERAGEGLGDLDLQIASIALEHDVPLVTHNRRHFKCVPGLMLEDWLE